MLSLAKLGRGREDYYLRAVGADATEYYSERGEIAGRWLGGGAAALGLAGRIEDAALLALLAGREPGTGVQLVAPPRAGQRMPGIDACFKAPKSVSLLWAFGDRLQDAGGRRVDQVVEAAHDEAVREALSYLEASAAKGRRGYNGLTQVDSSGFVAAAFRHRTSRAGDPHLHTHVVLANLCQGADGRWGALDARLVYAHAKAAGYLYEAHLRHALVRELGVVWAPLENGIADIAGVSEELIGLFSKRREELRGSLEEVTRRVNEERTRLGLAPVEADSQDALNIAAHQTRAAKLYNVATGDLRAGWSGEADAAGAGLDQLASTLDRAEDADPDLEPGPELFRRVAERLTEHASTFGCRDAIQELAAQAGQGAPVSAVLERTASFLASEEAIAVSGDGERHQDVIRRMDGVVAPVPTGEGRWTSPELLAIESRLVATALGRQGQGVAVVPDEVLRAALDEGFRRLPGLGDDQVQMVVRLATSGAGVECVEAGPGSGKTTALGIYAAACRMAGIRVIGCAPSAKARDELRQGALIAGCYTIDKLLWELRDDRLASGSVVIVDEASMAGTRKLARLFEHAAACGARVVLVGDTKQLSSVDAGGGFRGLVRRLGAILLTDNRRQEAAWERAALRRLRDEQVREALDAYAAHGRVHLGQREEMVPLLVEDWWAALAHGESVMQASRWEDVVELNQLARGRLVEAGLVERDGLDVRGMTIGVGDQVIVQRNDRTLGVINGTVGRVTALDAGRGDLVIETEGAEARTVRLPAAFWDAPGRRRLALAYCRTIHKAQGATYRGASFTLAGDDSIHLEAAHVALSRATRANHLYYVGEPLPDEDHHLAERQEPEPAGLAAAVARSRAQVLALDVLQGAETAAVPPAVPDEGWEDAPMTEAQAATLARAGAALDRDLTWVEASLLIDEAVGTPRGQRADGWLRQRGLSAEEAAAIIERAEQSLRAPSDRGLPTAVESRLEALEPRPGRRPSGAQRREREALERWWDDAGRSRRRRRRQRWIEDARPAPEPVAAATADRRPAIRQRRRT